MKVTIYGASDDLIEVEADTGWAEEFNPASDDKASYLAFSDGTVLSVEYTDAGIWRINRVKSGTLKYEKAEAPADDSKNYSDRATLHGDASLTWVVFGSRLDTIR